MTPILFIVLWVALAIMLGYRLYRRAVNSLTKHIVHQEVIDGVMVCTVSDDVLRGTGGACCLWDIIYIEQRLRGERAILSHERNHVVFYHGFLYPIIKKARLAGVITITLALPLIAPGTLVVLAVAGFLVTKVLTRYSNIQFELIADYHLSNKDKGDLRKYLLKHGAKNETTDLRVSALNSV